MSSISLSLWTQLSASLPVPLAQYYSVFDYNNDIIYISGGLGYDNINTKTSVSSQDTIYGINLDLSSSSSMASSDNNEDFNSLIKSIDDLSSNFYELYLGFIKQSLDSFKSNVMNDNGAGFYNNEIFWYSTQYSNNANTLFLTICNTNDDSCYVYDTTDENEIFINKTISNNNDGIFDLYWQPCIVQNDNLLYLIGGTYGWEMSNDILVYDMDKKAFDWKLSQYNVLPRETAYHTCSMCNGDIYIMGGYSDTFNDKYSNEIIKCEINNDNGQSIDECNLLENIQLTNFIKDGRSVCIFDQFIGIIGGEYGPSAYSNEFEIIDTYTDTISEGPNIAVGLSDFEAITLEIIENELAFVCIFGGMAMNITSNSINNDIYLTDNIYCIKIEMIDSNTNSNTNTNTNDNTANNNNNDDISSAQASTTTPVSTVIDTDEAYSNENTLDNTNDPLNILTDDSSSNSVKFFNFGNFNVFLILSMILFVCLF